MGCDSVCALGGCSWERKLTVIFELFEPHGVDKVAFFIIGSLLAESALSHSFFLIRVLLAEGEEALFFVCFQKDGTYSNGFLGGGIE